jgi:SAM-dependent methyltransferase
LELATVRSDSEQIYADQKKYWEGIRERRTPSHPAVLAFARPKIEFIQGHIPAGASLLEVGAGNGFLSNVLAPVYDLTALDFSSTRLDLNPLSADKKVCGDAEHLPFADGSFDVVLCANLLHHLGDPAVAVREMRRVATRHVVLLEPNALNPLMFMFVLIRPEERAATKFTPQYLRDLGRNQGLALRAFASLGAIVPNQTPTSLLPALRRIDGKYPLPLGFYNIAIFDC